METSVSWSSCKTRNITLKSLFLELCSFLTKDFMQNDGPLQTSVGTACSALVLLSQERDTSYMYKTLFY